MKNQYFSINPFLCIYCLTVFLLCPNTEGVAQVAINTDGSSPSTNTILDLNPAVGKAFIPPTMTWAQIKAISPVKAGMVVYDSEFNCLRMYNGTKWVSISEQTELGNAPGTTTTQTVTSIYSDVYSTAVVADVSGNVYVTGYFGGTATFGALSPITEFGGYDIFIVKYNSSGVAQWVQKAGGSGYDDGAKITVDALSNIYVTGTFSGSATFGSLPALTSAGNRDIFIAKYNTNGIAQWAQRAGGSLDDYSSGIALDASNNIYISGRFDGTITFGTLSSLNSAGGGDIFVAKYNNTGTALWSQRAGGAGFDGSSGIAIDASDNIYIVGSFAGSATFGTLPVLNSAGLSDIFIARLVASDGLFAWVKAAGGAGIDQGSSIAVDNSGNCYITGYVNSTATFGALVPIVSAGLEDIFIAKYSSNGTEKWVIRAGGTDNDEGLSICVDALGYCYVTGRFIGTASFGGLTTSLTQSSDDIFVAKYSPNGVFQWVQKAGGIGNDIGNGITIDASKNVYVTGSCYTTAQFGKQVILSSSQYLMQGMFLMKYSE